MEWLYNKNGQAELFTYDDRLISKTGKNLAWIYNGNIYNIKMVSTLVGMKMAFYMIQKIKLLHLN